MGIADLSIFIAGERIGDRHWKSYSHGIQSQCNILPKNKATHTAVGGFGKDVERPDYSALKNVSCK